MLSIAKPPSARPTARAGLPAGRQVPFGFAQGGLPQFLQAEAVGFVAAQDRFDDVRRGACHR
jgi:hypothetical protein